MQVQNHKLITDTREQVLTVEAAKNNHLIATQRN